MDLKDSISKVKGIGAKKSQILHKLKIETIEDLLYFFPRKYEDRSRVSTIIEAPFDRDVLLCGKVVTKTITGNPYHRNRPLRVLIEDNTGSVELIFFNAKYLANYFQIGESYTIFGKVTLNQGRRQMAHPEFHRVGDKDDVRGILPVYPLTEGISQAQLRNYQLSVKEAAAQLSEWLPEKIVEENHLCSPKYAIENIHFPTEQRKVLESRYRLVFEELLVLQTGLFYIKRGNSRAKEGIQIHVRIGAIWDWCLDADHR